MLYFLLFRTARTAVFACDSSSGTFCVCSPSAGVQRLDCPLGRVFPHDRLLLAYSCFWPPVCWGKLRNDEWGREIKIPLIVLHFPFSALFCFTRLRPLILWFSAIKQKWDQTDLVTKIKCKPEKRNMFHFIALYVVSILNNNTNPVATVQLLCLLLAKKQTSPSHGSSLAYSRDSALHFPG